MPASGSFLVRPNARLAIWIIALVAFALLIAAGFYSLAQ